jgi:diguanylate cyclase (GGDEF)-like protein/PAS domain S-box-containing protein
MDTGSDSLGGKPLGRDVLQQIVAACSDGVLLLDAHDPKLTIVYANPAYESLSGYGINELVGTAWPLVGRRDAQQGELDRVRAAIGCADRCDVVVADIRKDGTTWLSELALRPLYGARGELQYFLCLQKPMLGKRPDDTSVKVDLLQRELGHARQRLASLDRADPATGLLRFDHFLSQLSRDLGIARRNDRPMSVLLFEIVELDVYRLTFGSNASDSCLRMIGAQLAGAFRRAGDLCGRCDETTLIAAAHGQTETEAAALAKRVADKVRGLGLHNPRARSGRYLHVKSAVVAAVPGRDDARALVEQAKARLAGAPEERKAAAQG